MQPTLQVAHSHCVSLCAASSNIKTSPTPTTALRPRNPHNLELTPNQLHRIINPTPLQQLQTRLIHHDFRSVTVPHPLILKHSILPLIHILVYIDKTHKVLKTMTPSTLHTDPER